jgi:hypothetical protein
VVDEDSFSNERDEAEVEDEEGLNASIVTTLLLE